VLIIAMMNNAVVLLNLPVAYQQLMMAGVILGAVILQKLSGPVLMAWQLLARRRAAR
jgi:ribose transport system permease protein